jgi:hypothetical protein
MCTIVTINFMDKMYVLKGKVRTSCPEVMLSSEHLWTKNVRTKGLMDKNVQKCTYF